MKRIILALCLFGVLTPSVRAQRSAVTVDGSGALASPDAAAFYLHNPPPAVAPPAWTVITGKPATLAGYGITDAQPLDADLTAIAVLATTPFGRGLLTAADGPAARAALGLSGAYAAGNDARFASVRDFSPAQLSGLALWLRGSDLAGLADGAAVAAWPDRSGNGRDATQATGGLRPVKVTGVDGRAAVRFTGFGKGLTLPAGLAIDRQAHSVYFVARYGNATQDGISGVPLDFGSGLQLAPWYQSNYFGIYGGTTRYSSRPVYPSMTACTVTGWRASAAQATMNLNDLRLPLSGAVSGSSSIVTGGRIGGAANSATYDFLGEISEVLVFTRTLTDAEDAAVLAYLARPPLTLNLVADGDSLTYGYTSALAQNEPISTSYPFQLARMLGDGAKLLNYGVSGQTSAQMQSDAAAQIDPLVDAANFPGANVLLAWEITNSIAVGGTGATAYADFAAYCQARRAAGWRVLAATCLSRGSFNGTQEGYRQTANASLRANWPTYCDGLVDLDAVAGIGGVGAYGNAVYFDADTTHLTRAGYELVARAFAGAVRGVTVNGGGNAALGTLTLPPLATAPAAPASGATLWTSSADGKLHAKGSDGTDRALW